MLQAVAPQVLLNALRIDSLRLTDASFVDEKLAEHFADIVLECNTQGNDLASALICFLLEHKSEYAAYAILQLMGYQHQAWTQQARQPNPQPRPVIPVLFYHGAEAWPYKTWPEHLQPWHEAFKPYTPERRLYPGGLVRNTR